jgi:hypothetical protein
MDAASPCAVMSKLHVSSILALANCHEVASLGRHEQSSNGIQLSFFCTIGASEGLVIASSAFRI